MSELLIEVAVEFEALIKLACHRRVSCKYF